MVFRRLTLLLAGLGLAASLALAAPRPAEASTKITVTATGTILTGTDRTGTFGGSAGEELILDGMPATLVQVFTLTPGAVIIDSLPVQIVALFQQVTATVTVDGNTVTFTSATGAGTYSLVPSNLYAISHIFNEDETALVFATTNVFDPTLVVSSLYEEFVFPHFSFAGLLDFQATASTVDLTDEFWSFNAFATSVTVTVERMAVPAPAALALFLVGLAGLAAARRKA